MNNKISFYATPFPRVKSYYDMIDTAVSYNLCSVEGFCMFEFEQPDTVAARKIKEYADSKGVTFPCFSVFSDLAPKDNRQTIERLKGFAEVSAILGSPYIHHTIISELSEPQRVLPQKEELFERGISAVREIFDCAEGLGVRAIYEDQGYIFNGVEGFSRFINEVDRNVGVVADFGNIYQSENTADEFIEAFAERICHVHLKDVILTDQRLNAGSGKTVTGRYMTETDIGSGIVDFKKNISLLKKIGYNGWYAVEYGAPDDTSSSIDEALKYIKSLL